jgi:single-strand DNA-binding protein
MKEGVKSGDDSALVPERTDEMNSVFLTGNLGHDIEVKTSNGTTYTRFSLATNYHVRVGESWEQRTTWTRIVAFGKLAESLSILGKGSRVAVRAHLKTNVFEAGGKSFQYSEVIADDVEFMHVKLAEGEDAVPADEPAEAVAA